MSTDLSGLTSNSLPRCNLTANCLQHHASQSPMADSQMSAPPTERPLPNVAVEHRLNHVGYGHLGRISYSPVDDDDQQIGILQTGRAVDSNRHLNLLSHFTDVCPPTRSSLPEVLFSQKPSDVARLQENWLLNAHPEAVAGGEVDGHTLKDAFSSLKASAAEEHAAATSSLLSVGEITDSTDTKLGTVGRPAIAMAAGEGGHILHIAPLDEIGRAHV